MNFTGAEVGRSGKPEYLVVVFIGELRYVNKYEVKVIVMIFLFIVPQNL